MPKTTTGLGEIELSTPSDEWALEVVRWLRYQKTEGKSPKTLYLYNVALTNKQTGFLPFLVNMGWTASLANLTGEQIRHWLDWLDDKGKSANTRSIYRQALRGFFAYLKEEGEIFSDPFATKRIPSPKPHEKVVKVFKPEDVDLLLKACARVSGYLAPRDRILITILFDTGLRANELCSLLMSDLDEREGTLHVRYGKGGRERIVSVGNSAMRELTGYLRWRKKRDRERGRWSEPSHHLFIGRSGGGITPQTVNVTMKKVAAAAGFDPAVVHTHVLRHSAATALADAGMQEGELRAQMGWARNSAMVYRYTATSLAQRSRQAHKRFSPFDRVGR